MTLDLSPDELLTTTRSVRRRLDFARPVERTAIAECIEIALQAPTGSNTQAWHWVVVSGAEHKRTIADIYGKNFDRYMTLGTAKYDADDPRAAAAPRVTASAKYLRDHMHEAPYLVIPCQWGRLRDKAPTWMQAGFWGSVLPAAWSFMLALRARGLGSSWTTLHLLDEREVADLLSIPFDKVTQAGLFPVAYTQGTDFKRAGRLPAPEVTHWDGW